MFYNDSPNLSIIIPGGCNADCKFCFNKNNSVKPNLPLYAYMVRFMAALLDLPPCFSQMTLTGGEPTISPYFSVIMGLLATNDFKEKYKKIVLSTNGTNLIEKKHIIQDVVKHINISRHHPDEEDNKRIFGGDYNVSDQQLIDILGEYSKYGVDMTLNCVINDSTSLDFILAYLRWAQSLNFSQIVFRKEAGNLEPTPVQNCFRDYKVVHTSGCPACISELMYISGAKVIWKRSKTEPSNTITNKTYELIFHPDGYLYTDWEGKNLYVTPYNIILDKRLQEETFIIQEGGSCGIGFGGCG